MSVWDIESVLDLRGFAAANGLGGNDAILKLKCSVSRSPKPSRSLQSETEFAMNSYVAIIVGKAVLTFRAVDDDQARAMIDDQEGSMRSDLKVLVDTDGKPLWDGKSAIQVREATAAEHAEWKRSRDQAIRDGEIDLDARNDPDEWNVYLMGAPKNKVRRKKCIRLEKGAATVSMLNCDRGVALFASLRLPYATNNDGNSDGKITFPVLISLIDLVSAGNTN